jgi:hypothetical protein
MENSRFKRGAGYQPAAAHRAALVLNKEKQAGWSGTQTERRLGQVPGHGHGRFR